jgi:hypothetical protein
MIDWWKEFSSDHWFLLMTSFFILYIMIVNTVHEQEKNEFSTHKLYEDDDFWVILLIGFGLTMGFKITWCIMAGIIFAGIVYYTAKATIDSMNYLKNFKLNVLRNKS